MYKDCHIIDDDDGDEDDVFHLIFYLFFVACLTSLLSALPYMLSCELCVDGAWSSVIVIH